MVNTFTKFTGSDSVKSLATQLIATPDSISYVNGSAKYQGARSATSTFDSLSLGQAAVPTAGVLLTNGDGTPPATNTSTSYTKENDVGGDRDLDTAVEKAFGEKSSTEDASVLSFKVDAAAGVKSIMFEVVFGSDEFPGFSNTSFVDIAGIFVNGKNIALFGRNKETPLSILDENTQYFQDNTFGSIAIEYDGVSRRLKVIAKVKEGHNDIKIAIADTGDSLFDSGVFISNIRGSTLGLNALVNEISGTDGKDKLKATKGADNILLGQGNKDTLIAKDGFDILLGDGDGGLEENLETVLAKDKFVFKKKKYSDDKLKKADVIGDWDQHDVIKLSKISGKNCEFIGKDKFAGDGDSELRYKPKKKKDFTGVYLDKNGDGKTDMAIKIDGIHKLDDGDFIL